MLAGGTSSRMGTDKALIEIGGRTLLDRALETLRVIADQVRIVGEHEKYQRFGEVVEDVFAGRGPLGGIHAALASAGTDQNLIFAVDLPFVEPEFLKFLVATALQGDELVTVPYARGRYEPLCAVYRKEFGDVAERALAEGSNKVHALFATVPVRAVNEDELVNAGFRPEIFQNVNTRGELGMAASKERHKSV